MPMPYMERNLVAGLFHAAASLGIAESADATARRGIAGRINGDARPRMQVADNAVDLAASRGVLSRAATLIDRHRDANLAATAQVVPAPDTRSFRDAVGRFATGVAFVTAAPDGEPAGLIVNSFTSVSLEPPLVSFGPSSQSLTWSRMRRAAHFGVNVLAGHHECFATRATPAGADRFAGLDWQPGHSGVPLLEDALASLECEIVAEHPAGDHWIVVAAVRHLSISPIEEPLVFFGGAFHHSPTRKEAQS